MTVEFEFSLALNNRTGKYFIGRDILSDATDLISPKIRYWRFALRRLPQGLWARVLGRLMTWEVRSRTASDLLDRIMPRMHSAAPILFSDPLQCLLYRLKRHDVVICHDLGPITHPSFYAPGVEPLYRKIFAEICKAQPNLVFVTESSKREFERLYGASYGAASVISPAIRIASSEGEQENVDGVEAPFWLTVGAVGTRKNQAGVIDAFKDGGFAGAGFKYVICGGPEPGATEVHAIARSTPGVVLTGYLNDAQLRWLYAHAEGFLLPSLLEGFGMPVAEAISRGLIPLVSRDGALAEVAGPEAVLVNPESKDDILRGLKELAALTPEAKAARLVALRREVSRFSPEIVKAAWRRALSSVNQTGRVA